MNTVKNHWPALTVVAVTLVLIVSALAISPSSTINTIVLLGGVIAVIAVIAIAIWALSKFVPWADKKYGKRISMSLVTMILLAVIIFVGALTKFRFH